MSWFLGTNCRIAIAEAVQEVSARLDKLARHPNRPPTLPTADDRAIAIRQKILRKVAAEPVRRTWTTHRAVCYLVGLELIALLMIRAWNEETEPATKAFLYDEAATVYGWGRKHARQIYLRLGAKVRYPADDVVQELRPLITPGEQVLLQLHSDSVQWVQLSHTRD